MQLVDVTDAVREAEHRLAVLRQERQDLTTRLKAVDEEGGRLTGMVTALKEAMATFGSPEQRATVEAASLKQLATETDTDWSRLGRTEATLRAVTEADAPVGPSEIVDVLRTKSRTDDTIHLVSAALAYLSRTGKVGSLGRGRWVPAARMPPPDVNMDQLLSGGPHPETAHPADVIRDSGVFGQPGQRFLEGSASS